MNRGCPFRSPFREIPEEAADAMDFFERNGEETSRRLAEQLAPHLAPAEPLDGVVHAVQSKIFSADLYAVGVTPTRLLLLPLDRRMEATAPPVAATRAEVTDASVWGWGGSLGDFLSATAGQQIRFTAAGVKFRLMVLGGTLLEDALSGPTQRAGLEALVGFLLSARR